MKIQLLGISSAPRSSKMECFSNNPTAAHEIMFDIPPFERLPLCADGDLNCGTDTLGRSMQTGFVKFVWR